MKYLYIPFLNNIIQDRIYDYMDMTMPMNDNSNSGSSLMPKLLLIIIILSISGFLIYSLNKKENVVASPPIKEVDSNSLEESIISPTNVDESTII